MTVPDYIVSQTIAIDHRARLQRIMPDTDLPDRRPRTLAASGRHTTFRRQLANLLHLIANRIEQVPVGSR